MTCTHRAARTCGECRRQCCADCDEMIAYERGRMNLDVGFTCVECEVKGCDYCRACALIREGRTIGCLRHAAIADVPTVSSDAVFVAGDVWRPEPREWQRSVMGVWVPFDEDEP